ncbi:hypothetical protein T484DRAFT_1851709, partial [Baffinella frigidus]
MGDDAGMAAFPPLVRGNRMFAQGDFSGAIVHYTEAIDDDDTDVTALCNRSAAYIAMELYKTAIKDADAALAVDPSCTKAWERKGQALEAQGKKTSALEAWKQGLLQGGDLDSYLQALLQGRGLDSNLQVLSRLGISSSPSSLRSSPAPSPMHPRTPEHLDTARIHVARSSSSTHIADREVGGKGVSGGGSSTHLADREVGGGGRGVAGGCLAAAAPTSPTGKLAVAAGASREAVDLLGKLRAQQKAQETQQAIMVKQQQELARQQQELNVARAGGNGNGSSPARSN